MEAKLKCLEELEKMRDEHRLLQMDGIIKERERQIQQEKEARIVETLKKKLAEKTVASNKTSQAMLDEREAHVQTKKRWVNSAVPDLANKSDFQMYKHCRNAKLYKAQIFSTELSLRKVHSNISLPRPLHKNVKV